MTFPCRTAGLAAALLLSHSALADCTHRAIRSGEVDATGVRKVIVSVNAGELTVTGHADAKLIRANGKACANSQPLLDSVRLEVRRNGDTAYVTAQEPKRNLPGNKAWLDLKLEVPATVELEVSDSSGDIDIRGVAALQVDDSSGNLRIRDISGDASADDGSGEIDISNVGGNVTVRDGSGGIDIANVGGNVTIPDDSSGDIAIRGVGGGVHIVSDSSGDIVVSDVQQDVLIDDDSSGDIRVTNVGGNFTVHNDGSDRIKHAAVRGKVSLPKDK